MMVSVKVLTTPGCTGCAVVERMLEKLKDEIPDLVWEEIDVVEHPEVLGRWPILTAPGVVINDRLEFVGTPSEKALRERLLAAR